MRRSLLITIALLGALTAWRANAATTHEYKLDNGLHIVVREDHRAPVVISEVWYRAGSIDEFNGTTGVAHALEHMMFRGTPTVPEDSFSKLVAKAGGQDNAFTTQDFTAFYEAAGRDKLDFLLGLEADRMQNLSLKASDFKKEIQVVMEERRWRTDDQPQARLTEEFMATAFHDNPVRRPVIGWMNDLENMTVNDARAWYKRWYAPNNATLVVTGDVDPQQVYEMAKRHFGSIPARPLPVRKPQIEPAQHGIRRFNFKAPAKVPYLLMGWHVPILDPAHLDDREPYALEVLSAVLDGYAGSRLNSQLVRSSQVATQVDAGYDSISRSPTLFTIDGSPAAGHSAADLEKAIRAVITTLQNKGVTQDELKVVKAQVIASQVYQRDSMFSQAQQLGELATDGYPVNLMDEWVKKIESVTPAEVQAVARKYLVDDNLTVGVLDPQPLNGAKIHDMPTTPLR